MTEIKVNEEEQSSVIDTHSSKHCPRSFSMLIGGAITATLCLGKACTLWIPGLGLNVARDWSQNPILQLTDDAGGGMCADLYEAIKGSTVKAKQG